MVVGQPQRQEGTQQAPAVGPPRPHSCLWDPENAPRPGLPGARGCSQQPGQSPAAGLGRAVAPREAAQTEAAFSCRLAEKGGEKSESRTVCARRQAAAGSPQTRSRSVTPRDCWRIMETPQGTELFWPLAAAASHASPPAQQPQVSGPAETMLSAEAAVAPSPSQSHELHGASFPPCEPVPNRTRRFPPTWKLPALANAAKPQKRGFPNERRHQGDNSKDAAAYF